MTEPKISITDVMEMADRHHNELMRALGQVQKAEATGSEATKADANTMPGKAAPTEKTTTGEPSGNNKIAGSRLASPANSTTSPVHVAAPVRDFRGPNDEYDHGRTTREQLLGSNFSPIPWPHFKNR